MDRKIFKIPFRRENIPDWHCPTCRKGILKLKPDSFQESELASSKASHQHEAWDPDWITYVYTCLLQCNNLKCEEIVINSGRGFVDWDVDYDADGNAEMNYYSVYKPLYFDPHLNFFEIPDKCPDKIREVINESFKLFFINPSASANSVRIAVEELLTEIGVKRFALRNGKRRFMNLHERISLLPNKYSGFKDLILAIKWLGNAGSHGGGEVTMDDVMDAYELTHHILTEIYVEKLKVLKALAKKVNKKKGPAKKAII